MTGRGSTTATTTWRTTRAPRRTSPSAPVWWPGSGSLTGAAGGTAPGGAGLPLRRGPRLLSAGVPVPAPPEPDHCAGAKPKYRRKVIILNSLCEGRRQKGRRLFLCPDFIPFLCPQAVRPGASRRNHRPGRCVPAPPSARAAPTPPTVSLCWGKDGKLPALGRCGSSMLRTDGRYKKRREGLHSDPISQPLPPAAGRP